VYEVNKTNVNVKLGFAQPEGGLIAARPKRTFLQGAIVNEVGIASSSTHSGIVALIQPAIRRNDCQAY
jgi:hypothetical protein